MNRNFFRQAFTDEDRKSVVNTFVEGRKTDVFLLSKGEAESYMSGAELTASSWWWLRSPISNYSDRIDCINSNGSFGWGYAHNTGGIRPAMYVKE